MGLFVHRVFTVLFLALLIQSCGNKGELTLEAPPVSKEDLKLISADEIESEEDDNDIKKKDQRRE